MERGIKFVTGLLVLLVAATGLVEKSDAATYVVGDNIGWSIPSGGAASYASWAAKYTFRAGDILGIINKHYSRLINYADQLFGKLFWLIFPFVFFFFYYRLG